MRLQYFIIIGVITLFTACKNEKTDVEARINAIMSQMTLQEKIGQMNQLTGSGLTEDMKGQIKNGTVGSILNEIDPEIINELQRIAVEESRLGIPLIFARDVIHGFKTIFPIPLGQAASWNPEVAEEGARISAIEATASGIRWTFAPMIDISRDPRWGRIAESLGEDPFLTAVLGAAMIRGFQGDDLSNPTSLAACAKHFAGYGAAEAGKDYNTTWIPEMQLRDVYLPPFMAAVEAGVASFMCSFNDINGIPASGNIHLNDQILRKEWGYDGVLVSDWGSIEQMISHGVVANLKEAANLSLNAKVDMDMMGFAYINHLEELLKERKINKKHIDESVRNILRMKFRLGLFDNPFTQKQEKSPFYNDLALGKARKAAVESTVLLKNNNILPIDSEKTKTIAVVGPMSHAPADQLGTWVFDGEPEQSITPLMAIKSQYGNKLKIISEKGLSYSRDKNEAGIAKAVSIAKNADIILFFAGEEAILSGEAHCLADISLPGAQTKMLEALKETGKPIVTIIMSGRPNTIEKEVNLSDAVLLSFHAGTMAGPALIDLIFGSEVPSGKLPVTIPKMVGQIPIYYAHKNTGRPAKGMVLIDDIPVGAGQTSLGNTSYHLDAGDKPLFPFGYGLSYTEFLYSSVKISKTKATINEKVFVECDITNTGKYDALEVVQLYVRDKVASLARPVRELKGFQKIYLKSGETKKVKFELTSNNLGFWNSDNKYITELGEFEVWISKDSQSGVSASFWLE